MSDTTHRDCIIATILERLDGDNARRGEALGEFMAVTMPTLDDRAAATLSGLIPQLPQELYHRWASLFADRLLETVPANQIAELCNGTEENKATLGLIYLMFMESERMEKQIATDLHALGVSLADTDATGTLLGNYLRARISLQKDGGPIQ